MNKIRIEGNNQALESFSKGEVDTVEGIVGELIIPVLQAAGYDKIAIVEGLGIVISKSGVEISCPNCEKQNSELLTIRDAYNKFQNLAKEYADKKEKEIEELVNAVQERDTQIAEMKNRPEATEAPKPKTKCSSCRHANKDTEDCKLPKEVRASCFKNNHDLYLSMDNIKEYKCPECGELTPENEFKDDLCPECLAVRLTCDQCGGVNETGWALCASCYNKDRVSPETEPVPPKTVADRIPENNVWNTGERQSTVKEGWTTIEKVTPPKNVIPAPMDTWSAPKDTWVAPPAEMTVEPEQEDISEPLVSEEDIFIRTLTERAPYNTIKQCLGCGVYIEDGIFCDPRMCNMEVLEREEAFKNKYKEVESDPKGIRCPKCDSLILLSDPVFCPFCGSDIPKQSFHSEKSNE